MRPRRARLLSPHWPEGTRRRPCAGDGDADRERAAGGRHKVVEGQGTGGTGAEAMPPDGAEPDAGVTDADDAADDGGGAAARVRQARERLRGVGEKAEL